MCPPFYWLASEFGDGLSVYCLRTPLKPLPLSNRSPVARLRFDPPIPGRDPREPCHVHGVPGYFLTCESTQHLPWSVATTDGHDKTAASSDRSPRLRRHECSSVLGDRVSIAIDFNFHQASPGLRTQKVIGLFLTRPRLRPPTFRGWLDCSSLPSVSLAQPHVVPRYSSGTGKSECSF